MIRKDISRSKSFASMSTESQLFFCLMIPHFTPHGKMNGSPYYLKGEVVPLLDRFTIPLIEKCLAEISDKTSVKWFEFNGLQFIHALSFSKYQDIRQDRVGQDEFPDYSGRTPGARRHEVEVEVKEEVKELPIASNPEARPPQKSPKTPSPAQDRIRAVVKCFKAVLDVASDDADWDQVYFARYSKPAKELLTLFRGDTGVVADCIDAVVGAHKAKALSWTPETIVKHAGTWKSTGRVFQ